jgi:glutamine synthetase
VQEKQILCRRRGPVSSDRTPEWIIEQIAAQNIRFIELWFTDILGYLKSFTITKEVIETALTEGVGFDGSSVKGYTRIDESDMIAVPDPTTFCSLPWNSADFRVARMFADVIEPDGSSYCGDPRAVLKRNLAKAEELDYTFNVGPELEYYYFKSADGPHVLDAGSYFDLIPRDEAMDLRRETVVALEAMDLKVESVHHEAAPSQHEIDLCYTDALAMADNVMTYRLVVKEIAERRGVFATFMPKPLYGVNGSGMHVHMSLFRDGKNTFFDPDDPWYLSDVAKHFLAGLLHHAPAITAVTNQWVNSYKRLVPGYEAPVYVSWARRNRSDLVRVPMYKPGKEKETRIEFRSPDPACNPYLAFSVILAAGLDGIRKGMSPPVPVNANVYLMTEEEHRELGIVTLPGSLIEAIQLAEQSELVQEALGEHVFNQFIENKRIEWDRYRTQVTTYELQEYLPRL